MAPLAGCAHRITSSCRFSDEATDESPPAAATAALGSSEESEESCRALFSWSAYESRVKCAASAGSCSVAASAAGSLTTGAAGAAGLPKPDAARREGQCSSQRRQRRQKGVCRCPL